MLERGRYTVIQSLDSDETHAERQILRRTDLVRRGRELAERYFETGENYRVGEALASSTDEAAETVKWFCNRQVGLDAITFDDEPETQGMEAA